MPKNNSPRVLVVDGDPHVVKFIERQLDGLAADDGRVIAVEGVTDPIAALERVRKQRFDVVISDFRMAEMDGVSFQKTLASLQPQCVRLVLSEQRDTGALARLVRDSAISRYLPKPSTTTLRTAPLLMDLPEKRLRQLVTVAEWQTYKAGDTILRQNEFAQSVYFVIAGYMKVMRGDIHARVLQAPVKDDRRVRSRHQLMVALLGPGDMVGEVASLLNSSRTASLVALTPCQVIILPSQDFLHTMQQHPAFAIKVALKLAQRLVAAEQQMELLRGDLEGRIHALVRHCKSIGLDTERWLSNAEIARMVGATRAAVSPIMVRLQKASGNNPCA